MLLAVTMGFFGCRSIAEPQAAEPRAETVDSIRTGQAGAVRVNGVEQSLLQYHLIHLAQQPGPRIRAGNDARLLIDGPAAYKAIFSALNSAEKTIDIEMYIFDADNIGQAIADILREKSKAGIRVRLIYDSVGCLQTPREFFDQMRADGIALVEFHPVNPLEGKLLSLNNRDHRKMVIVDNRIAYTGGINISSVYTHGSGISRKRKNHDREAAMEDGWRDTQIEIAGPAVNSFSDLFDAMWTSAKGDASLSSLPGRKDGAGGNKYVRVIGSSPEDEVNFIYADLLDAIRRSRQSIHITMSYFSPNRAMLAALKDAARRGVDVQLVLPGFSDWWPVLEAGRSHYTELLDAGIRIYERRDVFLHAKTVVIDGVWATVGSSNMDVRSFLHNYEINVVILGEDFGQSMENMFNKDRAHAEPVTAEKWQQRSLPLRIKQMLSRIFSYWL